MKPIRTLSRTLAQQWQDGDDLAAAALADLLEEEGSYTDASRVREGEVWLGLDAVAYHECGPFEDGAGWAVCDSDGSAGGPWQIQAIYLENRFDTDNEVWAYVWQRALMRDAGAMAALAFIHQNNPREYKAIQKTLGRGGYVANSVGRSVIGVFGYCWRHGLKREVHVAPGSLWMATGAILGQDTQPHYQLLLLDEETRTMDSRAIWYDNAWYGFLELEPARPLRQEPA